ncbi:hypothetical protein [Streptomyces filamentosus]|uniref:hypothetical protein n=1 Tax=Streptomyces sp. SID5466 TaxID=2690294 RepID=UPI0031F4A6B9
MDPSSLRGSNTGVFAGLMHHDYAASSSGGSLVSESYFLHVGVGGAGDHGGYGVFVVVGGVALGGAVVACG